MKKLVNSLRIKILFRCDAGKVSEIGTGHLYRSIAIAKILKKKYSIKKNQIVFITKNQNKYNISIKILDKFKFKYMIYPDRYLNENTFSEINILKKKNIGIGINYRCVTDMTYYRKNLGWNNNTCKIAKLAGDNILSLPLHPAITKQNVIYISEKISEFFKN